MRNKDLLKGANVLVTGGTGFIGSHLVELLIERNSKIFVPYIELQPKSYFTVTGLKKKVHLFKLDLRDKEKTIKAIRKFNVKYIFHLAAQTIVPDALKNPHHTLFNNIVSTINILDAARTNTSIKGVIVASSDKAYGKTKETYTEDSPLKGDHPYDVSKSAKDLITQSYFRTYKTPIVITRFGNVYGEGDLHLSRIVPGICEALCTKRTLKIRSNGEYVRDYIYVKDVAKGYIHLLDNSDKTIGQAYNFSSKDTLSVVELIKKIEKVIGKKISYTIQNRAVNEIPYQHLNWNKVKKTGWHPTYSLESTFPQIFQWYQQYIFKS